jgi:hypothetical protein
MKLNEFFGNIKRGGSARESSKDQRDQLTGKTKLDDDNLMDNVYWFILDNDELHKKDFIPLAREIARQQKSKSFNRETYVNRWMPMVEKGCMEFYKRQQMQGDPKDIFTKNMRKDLCQRFADQAHDDISSGEYNLGD